MPDIDSAHRVVDDLRSHGYSDKSIHFLANDQTPLGDLPDAGATEKSDPYPQLARGLATGGTIDLIEPRVPVVRRLTKAYNRVKEGD